ncbi:unnamed protein product [Paramecium octaurelia]|uniref:Uncharacterized protein n=1 Tax=Paramecium octaurelia TaxID=43137 RepID=A0A8S1T6Z6_PAROT|nr:unnamed protein product [Paramecium octaurelia]
MKQLIQVDDKKIISHTANLDLLRTAKKYNVGNKHTFVINQWELRRNGQIPLPHLNILPQFLQILMPSFFYYDYKIFISTKFLIFLLKFMQSSLQQ